MTIRTIPPQKWRTFFLFLYLALLAIISKCVFGQWVPPASGGKAVWFYTGVASLLLGNHLVTPYFSKPVDAISYAVASAAALYGAEELSKWNDAEITVFYLVILYSALVVLISFAAIFFRSDIGIRSNISKTSTYLAETFGNHRAVFGLTMLAATYLFHRDSVSETFWLCLVCIACVIARPDEVLNALVTQLRKIWANVFKPKSLGVVVAEQAKNVFLVRRSEDTPTEFGMAVIIKMPDRTAFAAIALDTVGRDEANLLRCITVSAIEGLSFTCDISEFGGISDESAVILPQESRLTATLQPVLNRCKERFAGLVAPDTSTERLFFEVVTIQPIQQGQLVQVKCQETTVIYQILDGLTCEEIVYQKNTNGIVKAQAKKIGVWDAKAGKFMPSNWLPKLNEPVLLAENNSAVENENTIGRFPGGLYPVQLANIDHLVTHNTAILGILGVGKSMLAIELVERMIAHGIKVICLDLTDQYASELRAFYDKESEDEKFLKLLQEVKESNDKLADNPESGGSLPVLEEKISKDIRDFLSQTNPQMLKVYNPARIVATKQTSEQKQYKKGNDWVRSAPLWSVSPVEITRIVSEATLSIVQQAGMSDKAKVCLIYEEAHSLVPEWNSVAFEGDKAATAGTARAILQGRKYGMGCLLITQRTANVTKTILNQCNNIFAMRTFDDTGKEFLSNYVGRDYAQTLSSLREREAVFFGRASNCENPVLIRLNDKDKFRETFRAKYPPPSKLASDSVNPTLNA